MRLKGLSTSTFLEVAEGKSVLAYTNARLLADRKAGQGLFDPLSNVWLSPPLAHRAELRDNPTE